ncbi:MAG: hypothetical protein BGO43_02290 [Gammaproteobacteria bacterium 39-13]|nr:flagellar protein FlgN [Gammaproteobacteria bacterium]OJV88438.1 MAG: hypothetical protein BGO43_02290 [Gammaproteobacteria bacterium 39-13]
MDISPVSLDIFEKSLYDIHANLKLFIKTLDEEKALLEKHEMEKLEEALATKKNVIDSMHTVSMECQTLLNNVNFPFNEKSILQIISAFNRSKQETLTALWQEIKNLLKLGDQKNLVNGILITTLKNYNDALLQICNLKPQDNTYSNQNNPYSPALSTREHKA